MNEVLATGRDFVANVLPLHPAFPGDSVERTGTELLEAWKAVLDEAVAQPAREHKRSPYCIRSPYEGGGWGPARGM